MHRYFFATLLLILLPGCDGVSADAFAVDLVNNSTREVHIMREGESFDASNKLQPGADRRVVLDLSAEGGESGDTFLFFAGTNGVITATRSCTVVNEDVNARVAYGTDGTLLCVDW
jgi:hypothetical protein